MQGYPITVGRYEILRPLAEGGFGQVYLARMAGAAGFHRMVAIKRIKREHTASAEFVRDFIKEARIGGYLQHHHVVQVLGFDEIEGNYLLVMEFVDGVGLESIIHLATLTGRPIPLAAIAELMTQSAEGLQYIHTLVDPSGVPLKLVHRDIKPSNLLVSRAGLVKITDFGIARAAIEVGKQTAAGLIKGTLNYLSPEQARGEELDNRSDLYSLGAILYEMLTLERLWLDDSPWVLLGKLGRNEIEERLAALPEYAAPFRSVLDRLLTSQPSDRFETAAELAEQCQLLQRQLSVPGSNLSRLVPAWIDDINIRRGNYDVESAPTRAVKDGEPFFEQPDPFERLARNSMPSDQRRAATLQYDEYGVPSSTVKAEPLHSDATLSRKSASPGSGATLVSQTQAPAEENPPTPATVHARPAPPVDSSPSSATSKPGSKGLPMPALVGGGVVILALVAWLLWPKNSDVTLTPTPVPVVQVPTMAPKAEPNQPAQPSTSAVGSGPEAGQAVAPTPMAAIAQNTQADPGATTTVSTGSGTAPVAATPKPKTPTRAPETAPTRAPVKVEPAKVEPAKVEPAKVEPPKVEPPKAVAEAPGKLVISSRPSASVFIKGQASMETPVRGLELPPGTYHVRLSRPDLEFQQTSDVQIKSGQTTRLTCTAEGCDVN